MANVLLFPGTTKISAVLEPEFAPDTILAQLEDHDPLAELSAEPNATEDKITDLAWERDTAYAELEALRQRAQRHDTLIDALVKFIRELDAGRWASQWPLCARIAFETVRQLLTDE
jgi:hypothetical protein